MQIFNYLKYRLDKISQLILLSVIKTVLLAIKVINWQTPSYQPLHRKTEDSGRIALGLS